MVIWLQERAAAGGLGAVLVAELRELGFDARLSNRDSVSPTSGAVVVELAGSESTEQVLARVPVDFEALPILADGDSKQVRLWTARTVLTRIMREP